MFFSNVERLVVEGLWGLDVIEDTVSEIESNHQDDGDQIAKETIRGNGEGGGTSLGFSKDSGLFHGVEVVF